MIAYYRFQNEMPLPGEVVHCYKNKDEFWKFVRMMKSEDADFKRMKFWEIEGEFVRPDDGDVVVKVKSTRQIYLAR